MSDLALGGRGSALVGRLVGLVFAGLVVWSPSLATACAVCTAGRDEENQLAFLLSTIGMSVMPLAALGTLVFVLWRRIKKLEAESAATAPSAATPHSQS